MSPARRFPTLIGDFVGSKGAVDRRGLQRAAEEVLAAVNEGIDPPQPLQPTLGDEFQGVFLTIPSAVRMSLVLRLELLERANVDSRYGLGHGEVSVIQGGPQKIQDGPGWWSARAAIDRAKRLGTTPRTSFARTCFDYWPPKGRAQAAEAAALNAFLLCRDATVDRMAPRGRRLLLGLLKGRTQTELAEEEGVTQSAISQNLRHSGAFAIEAGQLSLERDLQ